MKQYADYMDEITGDELYEGLMVCGMFSEKLPPIFTSKEFFEYAQTIKDKKSYSWHKPQNYITFDVIRNNGNQRTIGIPSPFAYDFLCKELKDSWDNIRQYFHEITASNPSNISLIHLRKMKNSKSVFKMNYKDWQHEASSVDQLRMRGKYLVKADITNCFPSIYTHAIPWALIGKKAAKKDKNETEWYNALDKFTRNIKNNETHGILIGPHAFNLISEIILCKVDQLMVQEGWKYYIRNIDDYECYVKTHTEGEEFIDSLNKNLKMFGLQLNSKKTKIIEQPAQTDDFWVSQLYLLTKTILEKSYLNYKDIKNYWDHVTNIFITNERDLAIINYALKILSGKIASRAFKLSFNAQRYCISLILQLALIYPYLVPLLDKYIFRIFPIKVDLIHKISEHILSKKNQLRLEEEKCYALYFAIKYQFKLKEIEEKEEKEVENIIANNNNITLLLYYQYFKQTKNEEMLNLLHEKAKDLAKKDFEANWLFCYEVLKSQEFKEVSASTASAFKNMKEHNVSFLKANF